MDFSGRQADYDQTTTNGPTEEYASTSPQHFERAAFRMNEPHPPESYTSSEKWERH